jgi:hypothetical protein
VWRFRSNVRDQAGAKTQRVVRWSPCFGMTVGGPGEGRLTLWDAAGVCSRVRVGKACERRSGEDSARSSRANPGRAKPMGAAGVRRAKHVLGREGLSKGARPRNRGSCGPASPLRRMVERAGETVCGSVAAETWWTPFGRRKLRRVNPRSAAGMKQDRQGFGGRKPSRG